MMDSVLRHLGLRRGKETPRSQSPDIQGGESSQHPPATDGSDGPKKYKWKFIDANAFLYQGTLKMIEVEDFRQLDFVAISYTWSKNMLEWRKWILSSSNSGQPAVQENINQASADTTVLEDIKRFHFFFTVVAFLVIVRGKSFFWMDVLCIDQDAEEEKEYFVPKMGTLYGNTPETHVYLTGSAFVTMSSNEFHFPIWETRAWTLQEYIRSKNVLFCYNFHGDVMKDIKMMHDSRLPSRNIELRSPSLDRYKASPDDNAFVLEKGKSKVTCCFEGDSWAGPQLLMSSYMRTDMFGPEMNKMIGRSTLSKTLYNMRREVSRLNVISTSMVLLGGRASTYPEDIIYSVLGILEMEDYSVRYKIGFEEARMGVFEAMKADILGTVIGTDWGCVQDAKNNDSALPRIMGSEPTLGIERRNTTNSSKYTRHIGTEITSRKERFRLWKDLSRRQSRSLSVIRATMGSQTSRLMILYCASLTDDPDYADIPTSEIPEEKIHPVILSGASRLTDEQYLNPEFEYDRRVELVELGECVHHALLADAGDEHYMKLTAVLALECEETSSAHLVNRGTVLVLNASSFSGPVTVHLVQ